MGGTRRNGPGRNGPGRRALAVAFLPLALAGVALAVAALALVGLDRAREMRDAAARMAGAAHGIASAPAAPTGEAMAALRTSAAALRRMIGGAGAAGIGDPPRDIARAWETAPGGAPGAPALVAALTGPCVSGCPATGRDPAGRAHGEAWVRTVAGRLLPARLAALDRAVSSWQDRLLTLAAAALAMAAGLVALAAWLAARGIVRPMIRRAEHLQDRLIRQAATIDKKVAERTQELSALVTEANTEVAAKSTFLANMSHEIRTPMNGVLGVAALLARTNLDDNQRALVGTITQSGQVLLRIIDDVLDTAKLSAGRLPIEPRPVLTSQIVTELVALHEPVAGAKGLTLRADLTHAGTERVMLDPDRIKQILNNLIGNAIKFTAEGDVAVRLRETDLGALIRVRFDVEDTGIGIAPPDQARIFKPFERVHEGMDLPGAGIGLALSHTLVRAMGGKLTVASRPGEGARFRVSIPLSRAADAQDHAAPAAEGKANRQRSRPAA